MITLKAVSHYDQLSTGLWFANKISYRSVGMAGGAVTHPDCRNTAAWLQRRT